MTRGILYTVFGQEYDKLAAHTVAYSRQFTDLPICVLTNITDRHEKWAGVSNISFTVIDIPQVENRAVKTEMISSTPFDQTLYLDCDSVIQKEGVEEVFDCLGEDDILLNKLLGWQVGEKIIRLYKNAMLASDVLLPIDVFNGAFICFKKNDRVRDFFTLWNECWKLTGSGREMPALACAVKKSAMSVKITGKPHGFFEPDVPDEDCIVQHNYNSYKGKDFFKEFKLPIIRQCKPFDKPGSNSDWNFVEF